MRRRILPVGRDSVRSLQHFVALHFSQITEFRHDWIRCLWQHLKTAGLLESILRFEMAFDGIEPPTLREISENQ